MLDFHSHLVEKSSIVCTDDASIFLGESLLSSSGLLPDKYSSEKMQVLLETLCLNENVHLGEVGLDKRFISTVPMTEQILVLKTLLKKAISLDKCISLHCVNATQAMIEVLQNLHFRPFSILWHGFNGSVETASNLSRLGVIVSIGPRFKKPLRGYFEANRALVLETDYTALNLSEHEAILSSMYDSFSKQLNMSLSCLEDHLSQMLFKFTGKEY